MSDYLPPTSPPPPKVPEGWKAVWNEQYKEWFYVNLFTKQSSWEKPTEPAPRPGDDAPPAAPPPSYSTGPNDANVGDVKKPLESNNPYNPSLQSGGSHETDEQVARRLQQEEEQRNRGAGDSYYHNASTANPAGIQGGYPGAPQPMSPNSSSGGKKGFLGKLLGKASGGGSSGGYGHQGGYPQQQQYGGYPQQQQYGGGYPQYGQGPGYGYGQPGPGYGGGYGGGYGRPPPRKGGGMGVGGAAALGVGGGLLGGMLIADAVNDGQQDAYQDGYDDGGGGGGDDFGGGDF